MVEPNMTLIVPFHSVLDDYVQMIFLNVTFDNFLILGSSYLYVY